MKAEEMDHKRVDLLNQEYAKLSSEITEIDEHLKYGTAFDVEVRVGESRNYLGDIKLPEYLNEEVVVLLNKLINHKLNRMRQIREEIIHLVTEVVK